MAGFKLSLFQRDTLSNAKYTQKDRAMSIPSLKRVKISCGADLRIWINKNFDHREPVMLVTHSKSSPAKHVSRTQVQELIEAKGWICGRSYTLSAHLIGHIIGKRPNALSTAPRFSG